ncbi:hypothetical protein E6Q11_01845, partial [Candidatus Dojkabacteria bacterium]
MANYYQPTQADIQLAMSAAKQQPQSFYQPTKADIDAAIQAKDAESPGKLESFALGAAKGVGELGYDISENTLKLINALTGSNIHAPNPFDYAANAANDPIQRYLLTAENANPLSAAAGQFVGTAAPMLATAGAAGGAPILRTLGSLAPSDLVASGSGGAAKTIGKNILGTFGTGAATNVLLNLQESPVDASIGGGLT